MDAHDAAEPSQSQPAGASPGPQPQETTDAKSPRAASAVISGSHDGDQRRREGSDESSGDRDSDAETIVLPGKDGHSPSKARKVRQEDKSDADVDNSKSVDKGASGSADSNDDLDKDEVASGESAGRPKKQRTAESGDKDKSTRSKAEPAAGARSSERTSPSLSRRRRRSTSSHSSQSDGEKQPSRASLRDKLKPRERLVPHKRKAPKADSDSDDDESSHRVRRKRTASAGIDGGRIPRERRASTSRSHDTRNRSTSPHRSHRRSASTQLTSSNGSVVKKKRLPPPLQPTDYHSDESSASGSPHPRGTKARSLAASATGESNASPAKVPSHKKHLDAHGQTLLARACARGEFDIAKKRLRDRPEDLNVADYAGNTPLQIAAINGCEDIVELLIDAGCNLDCVNYDKDTPLLDAVDNGHLGVVKLLLDAGVNPRKANVNGEEPIDRVTEETDNAEEIRTALIEAKKRFGGRAKTSEDRNSYLDAQDTPESPRNSPVASMSAQPSGRRSGTVRATKTRNDLLYQPLDDRTLRQAAGRGDEEMVARILQVKGSCLDAEPMVAAARGGHDLVIQLLLGLGGANPDPEPVPSQPPEFATPILAAIGQENIKVLELLLEQQSVDPTRRYKGETYYEIAKRRQGTNWKDEEQILKNAYDAFKSQKPKTKSPGRRERDKEREDKRIKRETTGDTRSQRREPRSPSRDAESRKKIPTKLSSPKEKRRSDPPSAPGDDKRGAARLRKDEKASPMNTSDRETSPAATHKHPKTKRTDSEVALSSEGEASKPRRKLVSKGELRGEREKRRPSVTSTTSAQKEPSSPRETRAESSHHDRAKTLKIEETRDSPSSPAESSTKRQRTSLASDRSHNGDRDGSEVSAKRRRVDGEGGEKTRMGTLPERDQTGKSSNPDSQAKPSTKAGERKGADKDKSERPVDGAHGKELRRNSGESSVHVKSEDVDVEMPDADREGDAHSDHSEQRKQAESEKLRKAKEADDAAAKKRKEEAEREAERKKQEEAERLRREEEEEAAEKVRLAQEKARQEAEEKARREEEERKRLEEEKRLREEEERRRREEEERLRKEREAAEEARRKREEEERKERERRERAHREEMEKKRAAREAELRRIREEQERIRLDKLPALLRWLDKCPNPKTMAYAEKFKTLQGVRYDCIRPETSHTPEGREQWVLNTHAALLLGEKDLDLARCKYHDSQLL